MAEFVLVASGLLEVISDDLVKLDQLSAGLLEPAGEALVQLCACGFRGWTWTAASSISSGLSLAADDRRVLPIA